MTEPADPRLAALARLVAVIDRLRAPGGCPWDRRQSLQSMAKNLLEEAYEAVEALQSGRRDAAREELGDVLMNVVLTARIAQDAGDFSLADVALEIASKLVRRHPHVFGDGEALDVEGVLANWERIKSEERREQPDRSALSGLPAALPALLLAFRLGEKAARVGFEWPDRHGAWEKLTEEILELKQALEQDDQDRIADELGDVLFSVVNVARHASVEPEGALRRAASRFSERFRYVERTLGKPLSEATLEELEALWQEAKRARLEPADFPEGGPEEWRRAVRRLSRTRDSLISSVRDLPEDLVQSAPREGGWSIAEILEHLWLAEDLTARGLERALAGAGQEPMEPFPAEGLAAHPPLNQVELAPEPVEAPGPTLPGGGRSRSELLSALALSRARLLALLPELVQRNPRRILLRHPMLGELDALQWYEFVALHEDRHRRQILTRLG